MSRGGVIVKGFDGTPIHPSHKIGKEFTDIRCPASTPRFYGVRQCTVCKAETIGHPAGQFTSEYLTEPCCGYDLED